MSRLESVYFNELFELRKKEKPNNLEGRLCILSYELGRMINSAYYSIRFPKDKAIHLKLAKIEMGDLITQIQILCQELNWDFEEVRREGLSHIKERYEEFERNEWINTKNKV